MNTITTPKGTTLPLLNLKGKDYLQVPYRIMWFREDHPDWFFETKIEKLDQDFVIMKAQIIDEKGVIRSMAHKVEHFKHFQDALEKAETGAIGRALALIGYGTQFAIEMEEERLSDSPLHAVMEAKREIKRVDVSSFTITPDQAKKLKDLGIHHGWQMDDMNSEIKKMTGGEKWGLITNAQYNLLLSLFGKDKPLFKTSSED